MFKKATIYFSIIAVVIGAVFFVNGFILAWDPPTQDPPAGNVSTSLNISATGQSKEGGLILNTGGAEYGLIVDEGKVGIGATTVNAKMQINAPVSTEGLRIVSANNASPLNLRNNADTDDIFRVDEDGDIREGTTIKKDANGNVIIQLGN